MKTNSVQPNKRADGYKMALGYICTGKNGICIYTPKITHNFT